MPEQPMFLDGGEYRLFAVLHRPDAPDGGILRAGWLLCPPFAEEKKGAHRLLVDLARDLCRRGLPVLRFDYRGTGDSQGRFTDFTLSGALQDIRHAAAFLREQTGVEQVGLLGVRLGGALAAQAAADLGAAGLALWEPITNGRRYLQMNLRQKRIREMMTTAEGAAESGRVGERENGKEDSEPSDSSTPTLQHSNTQDPPLSHSPTLPLSPSAGYDFDGYWITPRLNEEIEALTFPQPAGGKVPARVLGVSVNAAGRVARELETLGASFSAAGASVAVQGVLAEPFWSLQDPVPVPELIRVTAEWAAGGA